MIPFSKHWIKLAWPVSLNSCQSQCLHLCQEIHLRQIINHRHPQTQLKCCCQKVHQDPPHHWFFYQVTRHIHYWTTLTVKQTRLSHTSFM